MFNSKAFRTPWQIYSGCLLAVALYFCASCTSNRSKTEITVFAAASMADFMAELTEAFTAKHDIEVKFSFAASSTLARQIDAGAQADIFISANPHWAKHLADKFPEQSQPKSYLGNRMVLVARQGVPLPSGWDTWDLTGARVALGNPAHVPAGQYAQLGFNHLGLWDQVAKNMITTANVREALRLVVKGECDYAAVYESDAKAAGLMGEEISLPPETIINYQVLLLKSPSNPPVQAFSDFLFSSYARELAIRMGFQWPFESY